MHKLATLLFLALYFLYPDPAAAQDYQNSTQLNIGVYMNPKKYTEIDSLQIGKLETRIINVISASGTTFNMSASRIDPNQTGAGLSTSMETMARGIVCLPKFEIYDRKIADTGLKKIHVVDASLTLSIQYIHEDIIFSTLQLQLQGSGNSYEQAITSIIRNLRSRDNRFVKFLSETRERILNYYTTQCDAIIEQARQLDRLDNPLLAVQKLWPIPREVDCHEEVKEMMVDIYRKYINIQCRKDLLDAKTRLAANDFDRGLAAIRRIDPSSQCFSEALELIKSVESEIDTSSSIEQQQRYSLRMEEAKNRGGRKESNMEESVARANKPLIMQTFTTSGN